MDTLEKQIAFICPGTAKLKCNPTREALDWTGGGSLCRALLAAGAAHGTYLAPSFHVDVERR